MRAEAQACPQDRLSGQHAGIPGSARITIKSHVVARVAWVDGLG